MRSNTLTRVSNNPGAVHTTHRYRSHDARGSRPFAVEKIGDPCCACFRACWLSIRRYTEIDRSGGQSLMVIGKPLIFLWFPCHHSLDSGSSGGNLVGVRVSPSAP